MAWRRAVLAAGTILLVSTSSWAEYSPYDDDPSSYDPYDYQADSHDPHWLMDERSGCWAYDSNAGPTNSITWSGDCRNGRADGEGTLTFFERGREIERLTGIFTDGMLQDGHVEITWSDGSNYTGEEIRGQFNGRGVLIASDGTRYDGQWRDDNFVGPVNRNPYQTGDAAGSERAPGVADNDTPGDADDRTPERTQASDAPARPFIHWSFLDGAPQLAAADGSELSFSLGPNGALKRTVTHADGSVADTTLMPDSDSSGSVRNQQGAVVAAYRFENNALTITYRNGRTETIVANGAGGLTVTATPPGGLSIKSDWYPKDRMTPTVKNDPTPVHDAQKQAATPLAPVKPVGPSISTMAALPTPSPKPHLAQPTRRTASIAQDPTPKERREAARREAEQREADAREAARREAQKHDTERREAVQREADRRESSRQERIVESPIYPSVKPRQESASDEDLPRAEHREVAPLHDVEVADNLPQPEEKPRLRILKRHDRHSRTSSITADAGPDSQPVAMHAEILPPTPEVHTVAIPELRIETPALAHSAVASAAAPVPARSAVAATPVATPGVQPVHVALAHTTGVQQPALRRSASDCLTVESNGTHWGFRNNCVTDIQFAYCVKNGTDRLTACGDSAVPGSIAAHGFTSLIADLSLKDPSASHAFRWVACIGGAGEVVPRLDQSDPPMGRCLHTTDLPSGVERADVAKHNGKQ